MTRRPTSKSPRLSPPASSPTRRNFLAGTAAVSAVSAMEWLGFFRQHGVPGTAKDWGIAKARAQEDGGPGGAEEDRFLIYVMQEGGWMSYSMFSPVETGNNAGIDVPEGTLNPVPPWSDQHYRVSNRENAGITRVTQGIRHGYLADDAEELFGDMSVLSSHYGNTFHSGSRWNYHYGRYNRSLTGQRAPDERTVMQAFAEEKGANFLLPNISWHRWLSDGELDPAQYPEGTGYYEKLGPAYAHTIYGRSPSDLKARLASVGDIAQNQRRSLMRRYTDNIHANFMRGRDGKTVQAFASALDIHRQLSEGDLNVDLATLFEDSALREEFGVQVGDDQPTYRSVNGNPARSKESPHTRVQFMMAYELMRAKISAGMWIETQDVRAFDSHQSRRGVLNNNSLPDQMNRMRSDLWQPLRAFVNRLKTTEMPGMPGKSLFDQSTIVLCSEMGRTIQGNVGQILDGTGTTNEKYMAILDQDVCQHWDVSGAVFMGGNCRPNTQFGQVGTATLDAVPLMPDGSLDPAYNPTTGVLNAGQSRTGIVPDAGHIYSTALHLSGVDPTGKGRNDRPALTFMHKDNA